MLTIVKKKELKSYQGYQKWKKNTELKNTEIYIVQIKKYHSLKF